jgi:hypothetical protein
LFKPTYKCGLVSNDDDEYVNKKEQSPSYTDRILFKNNTICQADVTSYMNLPDVLHSDHRPVAMTLVIKPCLVHYLDETQLFRLEMPFQKRGELQFSALRLQMNSKDLNAVLGKNQTYENNSI